MGNCSTCTGNLQHSFTKILLLAQDKLILSLSFDNLNKVNQIVQKKQEQQQILESCSVQYKIGVSSGPIQKRCQSQKLIVKPKQSNKVIIVYKDAFYIGKIQSDKANDTCGRLYLIQNQQKIKYVVKGLWQTDCFKKGELAQIIGQNQTTIFRITFDEDTNNANIKFKIPANQQINRLITNQIQQYEGELNPEGKSLTEMLSGSGKIKFRDGSTYQGTIKNGLMDTYSISQQATFVTPNEDQIFNGYYKQGFKHGYGTSIIKYQEYRCKFTMQWRNGVPVIQTFKLKDRFMSSLYKTKFRQ